MIKLIIGFLTIWSCLNKEELKSTEPMIKEIEEGKTKDIVLEDPFVYGLYFDASSIDQNDESAALSLSFNTEETSSFKFIAKIKAIDSTEP